MGVGVGVSEYHSERDCQCQYLWQIITQGWVIHKYSIVREHNTK